MGGPSMNHGMRAIASERGAVVDEVPVTFPLRDEEEASRAAITYPGAGVASLCAKQDGTIGNKCEYDT
eukprot:3345737-Amphidinium_carterae.1